MGRVAQAVMARIDLRAVICWMAKPAKENGSGGKKEHHIHELLGIKTFPSIFFYEEGLQRQHAKCARAPILCKIEENQSVLYEFPALL